FRSVLSKSLLQAGVELVAKAWLQRALHAGRAGEQGRQYLIGATFAGKYKILVERRLQRPGIGHAQHRIGALDAVRNSQTRFCLRGAGQPVVDIAAYAEIKEPVAGLDRVLDIK